jgi:hypothetical protein
MPVSVSDITNLIVQYTPQVFADGTGRETHLRKLIRSTPVTRPDGSQWKFIDSASVGTLVNEGDPLPASQNFTQQDAILQSAYVTTSIEISFETMDALLNGGLVVGDYVAEQVASAVKGLDKKIEDLSVGGTSGKFVGLGTWGLDTGSPAGINRAVYTGWQAYVNANGGTPRALTMNLMRTTMDTFLGTKQGRATAVLMSPSKATTYRGLSGVGQAQATFLAGPGVLAPTGLGDARDILAPCALFDEVPVYRIPAMGSDKIWMVDLDAIHYEQNGQVKVHDMGRTQNRHYQWVVEVGINLVVPNPATNIAAIVDLS